MDTLYKMRGNVFHVARGVNCIFIFSHITRTRACILGWQHRYRFKDRPGRETGSSAGVRSPFTFNPELAIFHIRLIDAAHERQPKRLIARPRAAV